MRFNRKRDFGDLEIFAALLAAGRKPVRGNDVDIYCSHVDGYGLLVEVKSAKGKLRPIQLKLQALFGDRYAVCRDIDSALKACGVK